MFRSTPSSEKQIDSYRTPHGIAGVLRMNKASLGNQFQKVSILVKARRLQADGRL
jgi:hypothetical protein